MTLHVTLPDGSPLELDDGATVRDAAAAIGPRLAKAAIAGRVTAAADPDVTLLVDAAAPLHEGDRLDIVTLKGEDADAVDIQRHSASHVMAQAIVRLFPGAKYAIGPTIENGFYYDLQLPEPIAEADLARIEKEMAKVVEPEPAGGALRAAGGRGARGVRGRRARHGRLRPASRARPALQGRAHRGPRHRRRGDRRRGPDHQRLPPGRVRRPLPRPAPAQHQQARQRHLQAHQPRRRLLARRREEPDAHPRLRHRLPEQGRAGGLPRGARARPPARPPAHRPGPRPLQLPRGGPRLPVLPPQGHAPVERDGRLLARRARARRLRGDQHAGHPAPRALGAQRPLGQLQREHVLHRRSTSSRTR